MPRTPSKRRCWPHGKDSKASRGAPPSAPGSTRSPPTDASTPVGRPAGARPRWDVSRVQPPNRPGSARSSGSSRIPTPSSRALPTCRSARRPATNGPNRSPGIRGSPPAPPATSARRSILPDILGFRASEVADMIGSTLIGQHALKRARANLSGGNAGRRARKTSRPARPRSTRWWGSSSERSSPPISTRSYPFDGRRLHVDAADPLEYEGRDPVARFCAPIFGSGRKFGLVPTRANGQPAFGA